MAQYIGQQMLESAPLLDGAVLKETVGFAGLLQNFSMRGTFNATSGS